MRSVVTVVVAFLVIGVAVIGALNYPRFVGSKNEVPTVREPLARNAQANNARPNNAASPETARREARQNQPPIHVNSFATPVGSLVDWAPATARAGHLDNSTLSGIDIPAAKIGARTMTNDDVIDLSGWAGLVSRGMRIKDVLLTVCDQVVGRSPVNGTRPDVAQNVHPNLSISGWSARIAVAHLPRCNGSKLKAWAVSPFGGVIWQLEGDVPLNLPPAGQSHHALTEISKPLDRSAIGPAIPIQVDVGGRIVNLRRCGDTDCEVVGRVKNGRYTVYIVEEQNGWTLIQFGNVAGWIASRLYKRAAVSAQSR